MNNEKNVLSSVKNEPDGALVNVDLNEKFSTNSINILALGLVVFSMGLILTIIAIFRIFLEDISFSDGETITLLGAGGLLAVNGAVSFRKSILEKRAEMRFLSAAKFTNCTLSFFLKSGKKVDFSEKDLRPGTYTVIVHFIKDSGIVCTETLKWTVTSDFCNHNKGKFEREEDFWKLSNSCLIAYDETASAVILYKYKIRQKRFSF